MTVPYICSACRRTIITRIRGRYRSQWQSRASFVSLSNGETLTDKKQKRDLLGIADTEGKKPLKFPKQGSPRPWKAKKDAGDILESIFETTLKDEPPTPTQTKRPPNIDIYRHIETAQKMMNDEEVLKVDVWNYFVRHIAKKADSGQQISRPVAVSIMAKTLFNDIRIAIKSSWEGSASEQKDLPTMTDVVGTNVELGLMSHKDWTIVIWELLSELVRRQRHGDIEKSQISEEEIIADLLCVWKIFCLQYQKFHDRPISPPIKPSPDWSCLPKFTNRNVIQSNNGYRALRAVSKSLFPTFPQQGLSESIACAAIVTYGILQHPSRAKSYSVQTAFPFLKAIGNVIGEGWINAEVRDEISQSLGITDIMVRDALWTSLLDTAHQAPHDTKLQHAGALDFPLEKYQAMLNSAVKERESQRVDSVYAAVVEYAEHNPRGGPSKNLDIWNKIIQAYMACRYPARAIEVWNHVIQIGLTPTIITWTSMLDGARIAKDTIALETVWGKLLASGVDLDIVSWTSAICGFIDSHGTRGPDRDVNLAKGIRLLEQMGQTWLEAENNLQKSKGKVRVNKAIKPTVHTLNAVMQSLFTRNRWDLAYRLIPWGRLFGIELDLVTYNTLLRSCIRSDQPEKAEVILQEIENSGLKPDEFTFTILLEDRLRFSSSFTSEERMAVVENFFTEMRGADVKPNMHTYGKLFYILIQDGDILAVQHMLDRMKKQNLRHNEYIMTILLGYYFEQSPPDLVAVEGIINEFRSKVRNENKVFWDRVIEGYSASGETTIALKYFGKYDRIGSRVGWVALCSLLNGLAKSGQIELAEQFVRDVKKSREPAPEQDLKGWEAEHRFWNMVTEFGVNT